jgi:tRNA dimethylallyltransferase
MTAPATAIALLGPTASGKSSLALQLARSVPLEIIAVDSAQVYRGMDIGTAKPGARERAQTPHHLIDIRDPTEAYSAARFAHDAGELIDAIAARGRLPLLVGGTMLYAKALRDGLAELPPADLELRRQLTDEAAASGWPALHARLAALDPPTAARLAPNDAQRIQRALEVHSLARQPLSALLAAGAAPRRRLHLVALVPPDRDALHRRIAERFDQMLRAGFLDEVRALVARGDLERDLPSQRAVGYRQAWDHLQLGTPAAAFRNAALTATRHLAKRQMTWLRSLAPDHVLDPLAPDLVERFAAIVRDRVR